MKILKVIFLFLFSGFFFSACSTDSEEHQESEKAEKPEEEPGIELEVENFLWRGMNDIYLYNADVAVLSNDYFSSQEEKESYLAAFSTPEALFKRFLSSQDKFSDLIEDYREMNRMAAGSTLTSGLSFGLVKYSNSNNVFGYVKLVLPGSQAEEAGAERGMLFNRVNGYPLTTSNFQSLLISSSFTLGLAQIQGNVISNIDRELTITERQHVENPVVISKILDLEGQKTGYLFYKSFDQDFDEELNQAFGNFKTEGVTDLILDLRYNGGGSVRSATDLASMITGQFPDQLFMKEKWNEKYQNYFEERDPESLLNNFNTKIRTGTMIESLKLNRVFVLSTSSTASASELIINGLDPYIEVVHIGEKTVGKFQASLVLYDSPDYSKGSSNLNSSHHFAIQPLVLKSHNANDVSDYVEGLVPDYDLSEDYKNLGVLGEPDEPLLKFAIDIIQENRIYLPEVKTLPKVGDSEMFKKNHQRMYIDNKKLPVIKE